MRFVLYAAYALIFAAAGILGYEYTAMNFTAPPKDLRKSSIVRLVRGEERATFCSGTVIAPHTILTAAHCLSLETPYGALVNSDPIEIRGNDNRPMGVYGIVYYASVQVDIALLGGDFKEFQPRPFIDDPRELTDLRERGARFRSCGYPHNGALYCSDTRFLESNGFMWSVDGVILPGMSGGPTMLLDGSVIAENTAVEKSYSIISPIYNIRAKVRSYEAGIK